MHHTEATAELDTLVRQPTHIGVAEHVSAVLILEHDDQNVIERARCYHRFSRR